VAAVYDQFQPKVSLRGFMRVVGRPYGRLRDYRRAALRHQQRQRCEQAHQPAVRHAALEHPTYGSRRLYHGLEARRLRLGREQVRRLLAGVGFEHERPPKKRRTAPVVAAAAECPEGRRVQIDATRLALADGVAWVYVVEDVASRRGVAARVGRSLTKARAGHTRQAGPRVLPQGGVIASLVIQRDGGSEFPSAYFQRGCQALGQWVRCRVNQTGGLGIVERLNRTFKSEVVFRHEVTTAAELKTLVPQFRKWDNQERVPSSLGYQGPWQRLLADVAVLT
jgi:putative transposase